MIKYNFLSLVMKKIRMLRPELSVNQPFFNRIEETQLGLSANSWFMTGGCSWDQQGGCTMCNYGKGVAISESDTLEAIKTAVESLPKDIVELFLSPSGSFLDNREVPASTRSKILDIANNSNVKFFAFETRAEFVTEELLKELRENVVGKKIGVEIGLESSNSFIRNYCINKGNELEDFTKAANLIKKYGFECIANVSLGTPFLNPKEAKEDTVNTVKWALNNGVDTVVIFPMHVKPYTLLEWLYKNDYYEPPSLWLLINTLYEIGEELIDRVDISWYRNGYEDKRKVIASPTTCECCLDKIYDMLDEYRKTRDFSIVREMQFFHCSCREKEPMVKFKEKEFLVDRVMRLYSILAEAFDSSEWWNINKQNLEKEMRSIWCQN